MESYIDIRKLTLDELMGVINIYPWFGGARKELCVRLSVMGDQEMTSASLSDASLYVSSRKVLSEIRNRKADLSAYSDKDIDELIKKYISSPQSVQDEVKSEARQVYVVGGDYFSQDQYDGVRRSGDGIFSKFAMKSKAEMTPSQLAEHESMDFYTETLAQIYAEQGYPEQAKRIYSKLILAYPEKNAYFAALIRKLEQEN